MNIMDERKIKSMKHILQRYVIKQSDFINKYHGEVYSPKPLFYSLASKQIPFDQSIFGKFHRLLSVEEMEEHAFSLNLLIEKEEAFSKIDDYAEFFSFLMDNVALFNYWKYLICDPFHKIKDFSLKSRNKKRFEAFIKNLELKIDDVYRMSYREGLSLYTPVQSMLILVDPSYDLSFIVGNKLVELMKDERLKFDENIINTLLKSFETIRNILHDAINQQNNFRAMNYDALLLERDTIGQFSYYASHFDIAFKTNIFSSNISIFLYHLDNVLYARSLIPKVQTNQFDVLCNSKLLTQLISKVPIKQLPNYFQELIESISFSFSDSTVPSEIFQMLNEKFDLNSYHEIEHEFFSKQIESERSIDIHHIILVYYKLFDSITNFSQAKLAASHIDLSKKIKHDIQKLSEKLEYCTGLKKNNKRMFTYCRYMLNTSYESVTFSLLDDVGSRRPKLKEKELIKFYDSKCDRLQKYLRVNVASKDFEDDVIFVYENILEILPTVELCREKDDDAKKLQRSVSFLIRLFNESLENLQKSKDKSLLETTPSNTFCNLYQAIDCINVSLSSIIRNYKLYERKFETSITFIDQVKKFQADFSRLLDTYGSFLDSFDDNALMKLKDEFEKSSSLFDSFKRILPMISTISRDCLYEFHMNLAIENNKVLLEYAGSFKNERCSVFTCVDFLAAASNEISTALNRPHKYDMPTIIFSSFLTRYSQLINTLSYSIINSKNPKLYIEHLTVFRKEFEHIIYLAPQVSNGFKIKNVLNFLSKARWALTHLIDDYSEDEKICSILKEVNSILSSIFQSLEGSKLSNIYARIMNDVESLLKFYSDMTERYASTSMDHINTLKKISDDIYGTICRPDLNNIVERADNVRKLINDIIQLLGGEMLKLDPHVFKMDEFSGTCLADYVESVSSSIGMSKSFHTKLESVIDPEYKVYIYKSDGEPSLESIAKKIDNYILSYNDDDVLSIVEIIFPDLIAYNHRENPEDKSIVELCMDFLVNESGRKDTVFKITGYCYDRIYSEITDYIDYFKILSGKLGNPGKYSLSKIKYICDKFSKEYPVLSNLSSDIKDCFHRENDPANLYYRDALILCNKEIIFYSRIDFKTFLSRRRGEYLIPLKNVRYQKKMVSILQIKSKPPPLAEDSQIETEDDQTILIPECENTTVYDFKYFRSQFNEVVYEYDTNISFFTMLSLHDLFYSFLRHCTHDEYNILVSKWNSIVESYAIKQHRMYKKPDLIIRFKILLSIIENLILSTKDCAYMIGNWSKKFKDVYESLHVYYCENDPLLIVALHNQFEVLRTLFENFQFSANNVSRELRSEAYDLRINLYHIIEEIIKVKSLKSDMKGISKDLRGLQVISEECIKPVLQTIEDDGALLQIRKDFALIYDVLGQYVAILYEPKGKTDYFVKFDIFLDYVWKKYNSFTLVLSSLTDNNLFEYFLEYLVYFRYALHGNYTFEVPVYERKLDSMMESLKACNLDHEMFYSAKLCSKFLLTNKNRRDEITSFYREYKSELLQNRDESFQIIKIIQNIINYTMPCVV